MTRHFLSITDVSRQEIFAMIKKAIDIKKHPKKYHKSLYEKTLMTFFQAPSLRTEVSFDVAMFQMGGEIVDYHSETSPWAKGKESIEDMAKVISRYCDIIMLRMPSHEDLVKFACNSTIPVINGLTTREHPCQILGDLMTIYEKKKKLAKLKLAYIGDAHNNVTHSLILGCALVGINMSIACPPVQEFMPEQEIISTAKQLAKKSRATITITIDKSQALKDADIVYTDSYMSYHVPPSEHKRRLKYLKSYQINPAAMHHAKKNAIFMHCLPAKRGEEVTDAVIDSPQSVVFDQAGNRLHIQKAILLTLLKKD